MLYQYADCLKFLEEQREIWQNRLERLNELRKGSVCSGAPTCSTPLCAAYQKELAMLKGVLLTFRRRIKEWQRAQHRMDEELRPKQSTSSDGFWECLEILATVPAPASLEEIENLMP